MEGDAGSERCEKLKPPGHPHHWQLVNDMAALVVAPEKLGLRKSWTTLGLQSSFVVFGTVAWPLIV